jgi:hypothetical protein
MAQPAAAVSSTVVIGEFRTRGPNGADDQFIEIYNLSASTVNINGYTIDVWDAVNGVTAGVVQIASANGTDPVNLPPYGHYLIVNGLGYSGLTPTDDSFYAPISANAVGLALLDENFNVVDAVSTTGAAPAAFREGTVLAPLATDSNQSYARRPDTVSVGGGHKNGVDTDSNSADFILVTSSPENWNSGSGPTAIALQDFSAQAQPAAAWLWPLALVVVLGGALIVSRRRA